VIDTNSNALGMNAHRIFKVESGKTLTLDDLTLKGGNAVGATDAAGSGGAIFVQGATVRITNCTLTGNKADKNGGAVWAESSTAEVIINSSIIGGTSGDGNKVTDQDGFGGGIVISDGTLNLTDTSIIGNKAGRGGGVYAGENSTFKMYDSSIANNTGTTGKGVYVKGGDGTPSKIDAVFIMGGTACVGTWANAGTLQDGNDVYLDKNLGSGNLVNIKIDKDKPITKPKAARITPAYHTAHEIVLRMWNSLDNSSPTTGGAYNDKFTVTPQTSPAQQWEVTGDGQLQRKP